MLKSPRRFHKQSLYHHLSTQLPLPLWRKIAVRLDDVMRRAARPKQQTVIAVRATPLLCKTQRPCQFEKAPKNKKQQQKTHGQCN